MSASHTWSKEAARLLRATVLFYARCVRLAFTGVFARVAGWTGVLSLVAMLATAALSPGASIERLLTTNIPAIFFLLAFVGTVVVGLLVAPVRLYEAEVRARIAVEALRHPRFEVSLPDGGTTSVTTRGGTTETRGGARQTVTTGWISDVVCLSCKNVSEVAAHGARARIMGVVRVTDDGSTSPLAIREPIELTWQKDDLNAFAKSLGPNELSRIWIGGVRSGGQFWIYRDINSLPVEYQQVFGLAGEYQLLIQIEALDAAPQQVILQVIAAEGEKPKNGIHRGKASVSLVAHGSPTVDWLAA